MNEISVTDAHSHFRLPIVPPLAKTQPCSRGVRSHGQRLPSPVFFFQTGVEMDIVATVIEKYKGNSEFSLGSIIS